ncbi:type VI secretion system amidase effector protein Tae4 [Rahnella sp. NRRL B-41462]|uniref:type VI secretion system amidase effector protein Tae4 n=1 Tax=Rahnella sp. NRRL B-41462 TaxID=1610579 RepID=UPI000DD3C9B5|nr:type VI secretion system amidase effector protein Tae4 [Rahnella sp. NRRL B-41462]
MARPIRGAGRKTIPTNDTPGSLKIVQITPIRFEQLWDNYVTGNPYDNPDYSNQCAIRLSATLHAVGIEMKSFSQKVIKPAAGKSSIGRILLGGKATATRADEMARWLALKPFAGLPAKPENVTGACWRDKVGGRTGIIFFGGYWARDGESGDSVSGGHIDLWNGSRFPNNGLRGAATNFMRFTVGKESVDFWGLVPTYSDLSKAKEILFWHIL